MIIVQCPICRCVVEWVSSNLECPFCSARCKSVDLGAWANESYMIAGRAVEEDAYLGELTDASTN